MLIVLFKNFHIPAKMVTCSAFGCRSRSSGKTKTERVSFYKFPKDAVRCREWIKNIARKDWKPGANSFVCSKHFTAEMVNFTYPSGPRLKDGAIPTVFEAHHKLQPKQIKGNVNPVVISTGYLLFTGKKQDVGTINSDTESVKSKQKVKQTSVKVRVRGRRRLKVESEEAHEEVKIAALNSFVTKEEEEEIDEVASAATDNVEPIQGGNLIDIESGNSSKGLDDDCLSLNIKKEYNYDNDYGEGDAFSPDVDIIVNEGKDESNLRNVKYKLEELYSQEIDTIEKEFLMTNEGIRESSGKENSVVELNNDTTFFEKTHCTGKQRGVEHQRSVLLSQRRTNSKRKIQIKSSQSWKGHVWIHRKRESLRKKMFENCFKIPKSVKPSKEGRQLKVESDEKENNTQLVLAPCLNPVSWLMVEENQSNHGETDKTDGFTPRITTALITSSKPLPMPPNLPLPRPVHVPPPVLKPGETYAERNLKFQLNCIKDKLSNLRKQIKLLHQQNYRLKSRQIQMIGTLKECQKEICERLKEKLTWKHLPDLGKKIFELHKDKHLNLFPEQVKHFSLELYGLSPSAYKCVREAFPSLPHPRTICRWHTKKFEVKRIETQGVVEVGEAAEIHRGIRVSLDDSPIAWNTSEESCLKLLREKPCTTIQEEIEIERDPVKICEKK